LSIADQRLLYPLDLITLCAGLPPNATLSTEALDPTFDSTTN
jgi:hypothetical protein